MFENPIETNSNRQAGTNRGYKKSAKSIFGIYRRTETIMAVVRMCVNVGDAELTRDRRTRTPAPIAACTWGQRAGRATHVGSIVAK